MLESMFPDASTNGTFAANLLPGFMSKAALKTLPRTPASPLFFRSQLPQGQDDDCTHSFLSPASRTTTRNPTLLRREPGDSDPR